MLFLGLEPNLNLFKGVENMQPHWFGFPLLGQFFCLVLASTHTEGLGVTWAIYGILNSTKKEVDWKFHENGYSLEISIPDSELVCLIKASKRHCQTFWGPWCIYFQSHSTETSKVTVNAAMVCFEHFLYAKPYDLVPVENGFGTPFATQTLF